jgi:hypothetical protein
MPANLNALIRYKTIDECLQNTSREWTIADLVDACNEALRESRGDAVSVSERTIRDDIRVMRSDILGFNAPISVRNGCYFYEEPYTLFSVHVDPEQTDLLARIHSFLVELRQGGFRGDLDEILAEIRMAVPEELLQSTSNWELEIFEEPQNQVPGTIVQEQLQSFENYYFLKNLWGWIFKNVE